MLLLEHENLLSVYNDGIKMLAGSNTDQSIFYENAREIITWTTYFFMIITLFIDTCLATVFHVSRGCSG